MWLTSQIAYILYSNWENIIIPFTQYTSTHHFYKFNSNVSDRGCILTKHIWCWWEADNEDTREYNSTTVGTPLTLYEQPVLDCSAHHPAPPQNGGYMREVGEVEGELEGR